MIQKIKGFIDFMKDLILFGIEIGKEILVGGSLLILVGAIIFGLFYAHSLGHLDPIIEFISNFNTNKTF